MPTWPAFKASGGVRWFAESDIEERYWNRIFDEEHAGRIDSWAYAFCYACFQQGGLHAIANVNMITNIGFGKDATHTTYEGHRIAKIPRRDLAEIRHPRFVLANGDADGFMFRDVYRGGRKKGLKKLYASLRKRLPGGQKYRAASLRKRLPRGQERRAA